MTTATLSKVDEITDQIDRLKKTECTLKNSAIRQLRMMVGDFTPMVISDSIFPTAEFKKEYLKRISFRIFELQTKLYKLKHQGE